jgi:hypothetical protein
MQKQVLTVIVAIAVVGVALLAKSSNTTKVLASEGPYKALTRGDIEEIGRDKGEEPPGADSNNTAQLTKGLNRLATRGWEMVAIEPGRTHPVGGPVGTTLTWPPTYIFKSGK